SETISGLEHLLGAGLADQSHVLAISGVMFVKFTTSQERNSPGLKETRRNIVARGVRTLVDRRDITIGARIERPVAAVQRNIATDSRALETWDIVQRVKSLLGETLTRCGVGILGNRQCDRSGPKMVGA